MLYNYLKVAWRNLRSKKAYAIINILGLSIGLTACLLIGLYVQDELSYDDFHEDADRAYRVLRQFDIPDLQTTITATPSALAPALEEKLSAIEEGVRVLEKNPVVEYSTQKFVETSFIAADPGFFEIFSYPILQGKASLSQPSTVVISQVMANKYFGDENPIGKTLVVDGKELTVTGVMSDVLQNSHLQFDFVAPLDNPQPSWGINNFITYVLLREGYTKDIIAPEVANVIQGYTDPNNDRSGNDFIPHLQPITGIHLGQGVPVEVSSQGNILYVYLFIALAAFIIILAGINFVNLATARSVERSREVGMRKTLGASRLQVATQFLGESILMTAFALLLALALCQLGLPFLNSIAGKSLDFSMLFSVSALFTIVGFTLFVGMAAGLYPALVLSNFQPSEIESSGSTGHDQYLRKGLVVFQFAISISLLICTGIVYQQLQFMRSSGLGFEADNVVLIKRANFLANKVGTFKQEVRKVPGVKRVTSGFSVPGTFFLNSMWQSVDGKAKNIDYSFVGFEYTETLGIDIIAGRDFSRQYSTDSTAAVVNKAAVQDFGWTPDEAVGKQLMQGDRKYTIVGVARDFHFESLQNQIHPVALFGPQRTPRYVAVRLASHGLPGTLERIQNTWEEFSDLPFEHSFLADDLSSQYQSQSGLAKVFAIFAALAIFIGCMGLLGLAAFMVSRRTKEIGIRKVLGATATGIVRLLSRDFLKLVALGFLIAVPTAWYVMSEWLTNFAYKIEISPVIFLLAGSVALFIALLTISWQAINAALMDPVNSLQSE